jgi:hypothetical protein
MMEEKLSILLNKAIQKFLKLAKCARENQLHGTSDDEEFCLITKLWSIIWTIQNSPESIDYDRFREFEKIVNRIGGREDLNYRPILEQPIQPAEKDCCDTIDSLWQQIGNLNQIVNYVPPTLQLASSSLPVGVYEVGHGLVETDISWTANKIPLDSIRITYPQDPQTTTGNLIGTAPAIKINLGTASPVTRNIYGWYNDREIYRGSHLLADDTLTWETKWPCYYGKGPENAIDDPLTRNAFIHSLEKDFNCKKCHEVILEQGEYFYYFFKYEGQKKQFSAENGYVAGSFKGTITDFRTAGMVSNGIIEGAKYGVIRFDNPGILHANLCVVDMFGEDPVIVEPEIPEELIEELYSSTWSGLICTKINNSIV